jgi:hypothetical protein
MTQPIHTCEKTAPSGERYRSARTRKVTTFCHSFRGLQTANRHPSSRRIAPSRATPTRHCLLWSPHTDEC